MQPESSRRASSRGAQTACAALPASDRPSERHCPGNRNRKHRRSRAGRQAWPAERIRPCVLARPFHAPNRARPLRASRGRERQGRWEKDRCEGEWQRTASDAKRLQLGRRAALGASLPAGCLSCPTPARILPIVDAQVNPSNQPSKVFPYVVSSWASMSFSARARNGAAGAVGASRVLVSAITDTSMSPSQDRAIR